MGGWAGEFALINVWRGTGVTGHTMASMSLELFLVGMEPVPAVAVVAPDRAEAAQTRNNLRGDGYKIKLCLYYVNNKF